MSNKAPVSLFIDDSSVEYEIKNKSGRVIGRFSVNPADPDLYFRAQKALERFNGLSYASNPNEQEAVEMVRHFGGKINGLFDDLLGYEAAEDLFFGCGALSVMGDGCFYFEKVLESIVSIVEKSSKQRLDKSLNRVRQATAKYRK